MLHQVHANVRCGLQQPEHDERQGRRHHVQTEMRNAFAMPIATLCAQNTIISSTDDPPSGLPPTGTLAR